MKSTIIRSALLCLVLLVASPRAAESNEAPAGSAHAKTDTVTLVYKDTPVREVVRMLFATQGETVDIDPCVKGTVTVELRNVEFADALHALASTAKLGFGRRGARYFVNCGQEQREERPLPGMEDRAAMFARARQQILRLEAEGAQETETCRAVYGAELRNCHAKYGPPLAPASGVPRRQLRIDPLPTFCLWTAKEALDTCLGLGYRAGAIKAGRIRLNGRDPLHAYSLSSETPDVVAYPLPLTKADGKWVLHVVNGFPDDVPPEARCRVSGVVSGGGNADAARNTFNALVHELKVPITLGEQSADLTLALDRADSRDGCAYGFAVAWLEKVQ